MYRPLTTVALVLIAALAGACSDNPEQLKREYVASGDRYFAEKKYREAVIEYRNAVAQDPRFGEARFKLGDSLAAAGDAGGAAREFIRAADLLPQDTRAQLVASRMLVLGRQYADAKSRLEPLLKKEPNNAEALILMGNALAGLKELDQALVSLEGAVESEPSSMLSYANLGALHLVRGEKAAAENVFKRAIELNPKAVDGHLSLANYYWASSRLNEAESSLKAALALEPDSPRLLRAMAAFYLLTGRTQEAKPYLTRQAQVGDASARVMLADFYLRNKEESQALTLLRSLAKEPEGFVPATSRLAVAEYGSGRKEEARRLIDSILQRDPKNAQAQLIKGRFLLDGGNADEALSLANAVIEGHPASTAAFLLKAEAQEEKGQLDDAITTMQQVMKLGAPTPAMQLRLSALFMLKGLPNAAAEHAALAVKAQPNSGIARLFLARATIDEGNVAQAEPQLTGLLRANPDSPIVQLAAGDLYWRKGNIARARAAYTRSLELRPESVPALAGLVQVEIAERKHQAARTLINDRLKKGNENVSLYILAGRTYANVGAFAEAEKAFKKAIELDASNLHAYMWLGAFYKAQNRLDEARHEFDKAAKAQPESASGAKTLVGVILSLQNKHDEARKAYLEALDANPRAAVAANNLAWDYANNGGNLDTALQLAQSAKAELPNEPQVNDTLGFVYYKKGMSTLAIATLKEAAEHDQKNPVIQLHLGQAYAHTGDALNARRALQQALNLNDSFSGAGEAKILLASLK